jgi:hypothetical protein
MVQTPDVAEDGNVNENDSDDDDFWAFPQNKPNNVHLDRNESRRERTPRECENRYIVVHALQVLALLGNSNPVNCDNPMFCECSGSNTEERSECLLTFPTETEKRYGVF